jgi:hypothetical protein
LQRTSQSRNFTPYEHAGSNATRTSQMRTRGL